MVQCRSHKASDAGSTRTYINPVPPGLDTRMACTVFNASASGSYDANGNLVHSSDGLGIQLRSSYDALDRLTQVTDPSGIKPGRKRKQRTVLIFRAARRCAS